MAKTQILIRIRLQYGENVLCLWGNYGEKNTTRAIVQKYTLVGENSDKYIISKKTEYESTFY